MEFLKKNLTKIPPFPPKKQNTILTHKKPQTTKQHRKQAWE